MCENIVASVVTNESLEFRMMANINITTSAVLPVSFQPATPSGWFYTDTGEVSIFLVVKAKDNPRNQTTTIKLRITQILSYYYGASSILVFKYSVQEWSEFFP